MFEPIVAVAGKELRLFLRDPSALGLTFLMPLMFIIVMSAAVGRLFGKEEGQPLVIVTVNQDEGPLAAKVLRKLDGIDGLNLSQRWEGEAVTADRARELVIAGHVGVALVFPSTFSETLSLPPETIAPVEEVIQLIVDPALSLHFVDPIHATVTGLIRETSFAATAPAMLTSWCSLAAAEEEGRPPSVGAGGPGIGPPSPSVIPAPPRPQATRLASVVLDRIGSRARVERQYASAGTARTLPDSYQQNVPGYTIFGVFWIVALLSGSIVRERQEGTFRRLKAAPIRRRTVLAGKLLPYLGINLLQIATMLAVGRIFFSMNLGHSLMGLLVVSVAAALAATSLGTLVATLVRTTAQAGSLSTTILLTLSVLGGCFVPRFVMPPWLRACGWVTPQAWALEAYQDLLVRGCGLVQVLPNVGALLAFAAAFFAIGTWRFRLD